MSWVPIVCTFALYLGIVSVFLWSLDFMYFVGILALGVSLHFIWTSVYNKSHYGSPFFLFIASEVMAFVSILLVALWVQEQDSSHVTSAFGIPSLGCVVLIFSSWAATAAHHHYWNAWGVLCMAFAIFLGLVFIVFQSIEFYLCSCDMTYSPYHMAAFSAVGLHLIHVFIGWVALIVLFLDVNKTLSSHYVDVTIWYWHFVDYMWLVIFTVVYCL